MAVMTDVREAAQNLIEYAIHRSMTGQDDRIWPSNTILECIGAAGPALDMAWALQVEKLSLLHPDTLPDFDLEGTLAALAERYAELVLNKAETIGIAHADAPEDAELLLGMLKKQGFKGQVLTVCYEPVTGSHVGPGTVALFFPGIEK